jgi:hypothetical protein
MGCENRFITTSIPYSQRNIPIPPNSDIRPCDLCGGRYVMKRTVHDCWDCGFHQYFGEGFYDL